MADILSNLKDWSTTASSNLPTDATIVGGGVADNFQQLQATVRTDLASKGSDIASAATADLGAVAGYMHDITGSTTITSFGTCSAGISKVLRFTGSMVVKRDATALILPGQADITTTNGDTCLAVSLGAGNWVVPFYSYITGAVYVGGALAALPAASDAQMETGSSAVVSVTPARAQRHQSACKAWVKFTDAGVLNASYNVSSITDNGTGDWTVNFTTAFSGVDYGVFCTVADLGNNHALMPVSPIASSCQVRARNPSAALTDIGSLYAAFFGDQ
jgi:hypothetical protein